MLSRRHLLRSAAGALGTLGALSLPRQARAGSARRIVILMARGGWDTTVVFDPKPGVPGIDGANGTVESFQGIDILTDPSRPSVAHFFETWAHRSAVINGIDTGALSHLPAVTRMLTGTRFDDQPDFGCIVAADQGATMPVPYMDLGGGAKSGDLGAVFGRLGQSGQLVTLLDRDLAFATAPDGVPQAAFRPTSAETSAIDAFLARRAESLQARRPGAANEARLLAWEESRERARLLAQVEAIPQQVEVGVEVDFAAQITLARTLLREDVCHAVFLDTRQSWDTHAKNDSQSDMFEACFAGLSSLVDGLDADGLLDDTTVVVLSEFGRTPVLNEDLGKDHWPVTSALLVGGGVAPGVYGGTDDGLAALPVDAEGRPASLGTHIDHQRFVAGVLAHAGVDPTPHLGSVEAFDAWSV